MALKKKYRLINQTESIVIVRNNDAVYSISPKSEIVIMKGQNEKLTYPSNSLKIIELEEDKTQTTQDQQPTKDKDDNNNDEIKIEKKGKQRGRGRKTRQDASDVKIETSEEGN